MWCVAVTAGDLLVGGRAGIWWRRLVVMTERNFPRIGLAHQLPAERIRT
tara:strand:+ start:2007 stop:2153 length:147 start_codon:yes stop_codon:yes gene_type:complete